MAKRGGNKKNKTVPSVDKEIIKRTTSSTSNESPSKRRKVAESKEEILSKIIAKFNLALNELFHLKEYKSVIYWNPTDFSLASSRQVPELFQDFLKDPKFQIQWTDDSETDKDLNNLPLRLQKKVIAERERKLSEKFPFKETVLQQCKEVELNYLNMIEDSASDLKDKVNGHAKSWELSEADHKKKISKAKEHKESNNQRVRNNSRVKKEEKIQESEVIEENKSFIDEGDESDTQYDENIDTSYKLKAIKYSIPQHIVTHPSHIPSWRPDPSNNQDISHNGEHKVIEYKPEAIQVISTPNVILSAPEVERKISNFLENQFKVAIVDDTNMEYSNTPQEYETIMKQQMALLKKIYEKVNIEKSFELNGDKIEKRKLTLPHSSNSKQSVDPFRSTGCVAPKIQGALNNLTYHDHFLSQGMAFSKIHQQVRKNRQLRTRKIAQMIEQHFKKKKGEKERLAREQELNLKKISRIAVQAVKKRWTQAHKVYRYLQQQKEEELKKLKGREHLSQMLEHSTQLLEAQLSRPSKEPNVGSETSDIEKSDIENSDIENSENLLESDDDMSSSESEPESKIDIEAKKEEKDDNNDIDLTVEQLKEKYANLNSVTASPESDGDISSDSDNTSTGGLKSLYENEDMGEIKIQKTEEYSEEQKKLILLYANDKQDTILDENDSQGDSVSSDLESDSGSDSGSESDLESSSDEGANEIENGKSSSLATLFSKDALEDDDKDDEVVAYDDEEDDDSMSTDSEDEPVTPNSTDIKQKSENLKEEEVNGSKVQDVPLPSLLRGTLRPYQKQGLNWLASLYNNNTNGILADEMGLGKTIQTISLLSYLACEHHIWGPHLIIVPTSVMLNWEMEFKKFAPGFKVLTYYGSPQQRAQKRKGWNKPNAFHVCITSYQLVVHDHQSFKRRKWRYMILDEAHNIKNFRSTRWRALLNFNTENRLLLTGTPLQNNLMELWSLLYFLMPSSKVNQAMPEGFANLEDFQTWFGKPVDRILEQKEFNLDLIDDNQNATDKMDEETKNTVSRLHQVLRPYLLRRLKKDVEKQMPGKYEHIVYCRLSKRQRFLYDDFMSRAKTKETLASGNFLSIINCFMQLRKVCNHPDLFEVRPIITSFTMNKSVSSPYRHTENIVRRAISTNYENEVDLKVLNLDISNTDNLNYFVAQSTNKLKTIDGFTEQIKTLDKLIDEASEYKSPQVNGYLEFYKSKKVQSQIEVKEKLKHIMYLNSLRCKRAPLLGESIIKRIGSIVKPQKYEVDSYRDLVLSLSARAEAMNDIIEKYSVVTPAVVALDMKDQLIPISTQRRVREDVAANRIENPFHKSQVKLSIAFPDKSLLQYDCGKLQKLASLLQDLTSNGHRALIFTQMTKVLDILEQFLNINGYRYMRLDGATKIEDRQLLTERFNRDPKIPVFILSTRSGGLGINLTGADTVIFYDSDWNPSMDKQCQDRCHRIGQSRDVHIYRFVSEYTIESNILRKANQKRHLDNVVIQEGEFTTDYFGKFSVKDLVTDMSGGDIQEDSINMQGTNVESALAQVEDEDDRVAANAAMKEVAVDDEDFIEESKPATTEGTPHPSDQRNKDNLDDADFDEGFGHIDEYMLRFIADGYYWD